MKRILFVFICSFVCFIGYAQKKLFDNAIAAGRQPDQFYVLRNDKNKMLKLDDLNEYAQKEGYIIGNTTLKEISRFGDTDESVYTFEFLPQKEYTSYVFSNINSHNNIKLSELSSQGAAYCFMGWDNALVFKRLNNINWSGSVNNGLLEGYGVGYVENISHRIITVEGTFEKGFPVGATKTIIYDMGGANGPFNPKLMSVKSETIGKMSDGRAMIERNGVYGFVDDKGKIVIEPTFQKVLQDFADGQAFVKKDNKEIIIDKNGSFIDYTQHQKELDKREKEYNERVKREAEAKKEAEKAAEKAAWDKAMAPIRSKVEQMKKKYGAATVNNMLKTGEIKVGHSMAFLNEYYDLIKQFDNIIRKNGGIVIAYPYLRIFEPTIQQMYMYGNKVRVVQALAGSFVVANFYIVNGKVVGVRNGSLWTAKELAE